ncbi:MAG: hypothetical protein AB7O39_11945 [Flavobacteriaceae bacterium]
MADYVAVLNRAIASVGATTPEARQALYDKARKALIAQLESRDPPLTALQLSEQKSLLDRAVRQVEAEQTGRAFTPSTPPARPTPPASSPSMPSPPPAAAAAPQTPSPPPATQVPGGDASQAAARGQETLRSAVDDSGQLGHAAASASRGARNMLDESEEPSESDEIAAIVRQVEDREHARLSASRAGTPPPFVRAGGDRDRHHDADEDMEGSRARSGRGLMGWIWLLVILVVLAGVGYLGWSQRETLGSWVAQMTGGEEGSSTVPVKNEDRLSDTPVRQAEQPAQPAPTQQPAPSAESAGPPATQAALIEENPDDPSRAQIHQGKVRWTARQDGGETVIDGQIDIPEKRLVLALTIRKNGDQTLPASHVIELLFTVPADFSGGGISNVPGLLMKATPQAQGAPLAGESVRVTNGYFWIGLSNAEVELRRNLNELKQRDFIDIPVVYDNGRRAILSIAKGPDGEAAFDEAFKAWQE